MAYENIRIEHGNFAIGRDGSSFYTMDHDDNRLIQKNSSGTTIFSYFLAEDITEVQALKYDGFYFWSLERQGTVGFRVRKWQIDAVSNLVRVVFEFSQANNGVNIFDSYAMAVEYYSDTLTSLSIIGSPTITVDDGSVVREGDILMLGPTTAVGHEGKYQAVTVRSKAGKVLTLEAPLSVPFNPATPIYFTRNVFVFSDKATAGMSGALYKFRAKDGEILTSSISNMFNTVRAAVFFRGYLMFVRAGEVIWLDPESQNIIKSQGIDNLDISRGEYLVAADLAGFSDTLYRLEQEHIFWNGAAGTFNSEDWAPLYNYNTSSVIPQPYFVSVKADPAVIHIAATGVSVNDTKSALTVQVLDQFRTPVFNRLVTFASDAGAISPISATTDSEGIVRATYTANARNGQVIVTATVT